jgi:hypothetical protein
MRSVTGRSVAGKTSPLLLALLAACSPEPWQVKDIEGGGSYRYRQENLNYNALRESVESPENARTDSSSKVTRIHSPPEDQVYLFTEPGHPAHPAVIILQSSEGTAAASAATAVEILRPASCGSLMLAIRGRRCLNGIFRKLELNIEPNPPTGHRAAISP